MYLGFKWSSTWGQGSNQVQIELKLSSDSIQVHFLWSSSLVQVLSSILVQVSFLGSSSKVQVEFKFNLI